MLETRIYAEIPVEVDDSTVGHVVTTSGKLPSALYETQHARYEDTVLDIGTRAIGRMTIASMLIDDSEGRIIYRTAQAVAPDQIQFGYRASYHSARCFYTV